jgi:gluconokinase
MTAFILMGVAGAGKTTVGKRVAAELGLTFYEGDDFHPPENVAKMASGTPLTDADRVPWINALVGALNARTAGDAIVACSALSGFVRECIRAGAKEPVEFIWLTGPPEIIKKRLTERGPHYMKPNMLDSQFAALQPPSAAQARQVDVGQPLDMVVGEVIRIIEATRSRRS